MLALVPFCGIGVAPMYNFTADTRGCSSFAEVILCTKGSLKAKDAPELLRNLA